MRMRVCMDCTRRSYKIGLRNRKGTVTIAIADRDRSDCVRASGISPEPVRSRSGRDEINARCASGLVYGLAYVVGGSRANGAA